MSTKGKIVASYEARPCVLCLDSRNVQPAELDQFRGDKRSSPIQFSDLVEDI